MRQDTWIVNGHLLEIKPGRHREHHRGYLNGEEIYDGHRPHVRKELNTEARYSAERTPELEEVIDVLYRHIDGQNCEWVVSSTFDEVCPPCPQRFEASVLLGEFCEIMEVYADHGCQQAYRVVDEPAEDINELAEYR